VQQRRAMGQRGHCRRRHDLERGGYRPALVGILTDRKGEPFKRYWSAGRSKLPVNYYVAPRTGRRFNAEAFDAELMRVLREMIAGPEAFAETLKAAQTGHERRLVELRGEITRV